MMRRQIKKITGLIIGVITMVFAANAAALTVIASGVPGAGTTTFTFSGTSSVISGTGHFQSLDEVGNEPRAWFDLGAFFDSAALNSRDFVAANATASIAVNGVIQNLHGIYIDADMSDPIATSYAWGVYLPSGVSSLSFNAGDVVSWTGSLVINVDFSTFVAGSYASNFFPSHHDIGVLDMALIVDDPAQAPLPAASLLFLGGLGMLFSFHRRNREPISAL